MLLFTGLIKNFNLFFPFTWCDFSKVIKFSINHFILCWVSPTFSAVPSVIYGSSGDQSANKPTSQTRRAVPIVEVYHYSITNPMFLLLYFDLRPGPKILFQGNTPEGSDTFQRPVIEKDHVGGLRLMIWDKVKAPLCHYSHAPEESNLWTAWQLFPLDDD